MNKEIDTWYTDVPVCPHCGHRHEDYIDFVEGAEFDCSMCGKTFLCDCETEVYFTTSKVKE
jgi:transposase-like protein